MSIDIGLYAYLSAQASITALVATRIYPGQAPENATKPYIVLHVRTERRFPSVSGPSGMVRRRLQTNIMASSQLSARAVFDALRDRLDGFRNGLMGAENVLSVNLEDFRPQVTPPTTGADPGVWEMQADWIVLYGETATSV